MIVDDTKPCDSAACRRYLTLLKEKYPALTVESLGKTEQGTDLLCAAFGEGEGAPALIVGAHHALEWITSLLLLRFLEEFLDHAYRRACLGDFDPSYILKTRRVYLVPMLNPDGVDLHVNGGPAFACWQANSRGVDLNHNYDACWESAKKLEPLYQIAGPGPTRYGGDAPESEAETRALCDLVRRIRPRHVTAYHTQGEVIYYDFLGNVPKNGRQLAQMLANLSGYTLAQTEGIASYGGFKDWAIAKLGIPGFTIEAGLGKNPLPLSDFPELYEKNREALLLLCLI